MVCAFEFPRSFFHPYLKFIAGSPEGCFRLPAPRNQSISDHFTGNECEKKWDIPRLHQKGTDRWNEIIENRHSAEANGDPARAPPAKPSAGNYRNREEEPKRVPEGHLQNERQEQGHGYEADRERVARQRTELAQLSVSGLHSRL